jgi:hypothetical protein
MGIFTSEDYAIGGSPKIKESTIALGFINLDDAENIDDPLTKYNVQCHTENTINNLHNRRIDFIGFHKQPDDVIKSAHTMGYKVIIVSDVGTFINSQPLINILKSIDQGYALVGHLLDKDSKYYQIHNQFFVLDLEAWESAGMPSWADRETDVLQNVERSADSFHDGYTPTEIRKGKGKREYIHPANGSKIISGLLSKDFKIRPFDSNERHNKYFLYHNDEWKANLRIRDYFEQNFFPMRGYFYTVETEKTPTFEIDDDISVYTGIAASLHPFKMMKHFGLSNLREMILFDISYSAVRFYESLELWDGVDYNSMIMAQRDMITGNRTMADSQKYFEDTQEFCSPWEFIVDMYHDTPKHYHVGNLLADRDQRHIMHRFNKDDNVLFHVSNIFNYEISTHATSIYSRYFSWINLLFYAKKYTNRTHFVGSNIFGKSYVNTDDLDLNQIIDKVDSLTYTPWQERQKEKFKESIRIRYEKNMNVSI